MATKKMPPSPKTGPKPRHIAGVGLKKPEALSRKQVQALAASVEAHIEPRKHPHITIHRSTRGRSR
jgi:hypothetical protein